MSEIKTWAFWRAFLAEALGMTIFVFIGLSAAIGDRNNTYPDQELKVAFAFGLVIATLAQCIGHISGAHLNPAITLGLLVSFQTSILRALFYIIAQVLAAVTGSAIVYGKRPEATDSLGVNELNRVTPSQGFAIEFLLTLQLVLCVLAVTDKRRNLGGFAPLSIGLSVGHLAGVFWVGPKSAGVAAALLYNYLLTTRDEPFSEKTRALFCSSSSGDNGTQEPLLENTENGKGSKRPAEV